MEPRTSNKVSREIYDALRRVEEISVLITPTISQPKVDLSQEFIRGRLRPVVTKISAPSPEEIGSDDQLVAKLSDKIKAIVGEEPLWIESAGVFCAPVRAAHVTAIAKLRGVERIALNGTRRLKD